ncbi:MAG: hypothetical protein VW954_06915 [Alphaproteobacteria bacterium]|jgi:hypothetical protein
MDKNKKEKLKNWLETGIRETDKERLYREKQSVENEERQENLINHGKNMTDMEIIHEASLKKILKEFLNRLAEIEQLKTTSTDKKFLRLLKKQKKIIQQTLDEIQAEQINLRINKDELSEKLKFFNLEFEKIKNYKETKLKETNKERIAREKRIEDAAPYRQYEAPLTPRDKDY